MAAFEPLKVKIDDSGIKKLLEMGRRAGSLEPAFRLIGETVRTSMVKNFEVGGRYSEPGSPKGGNKKWKPLAIATLYSGRKKKNVLNKKGGYRKGMSPDEIRERRKILIKSGLLMSSLTYIPSNGGVVIGSNRDYAAIQNFGGKAGRGRKITIPARPFLVVQNEDWREINLELTDYILRGVLHAR